MLALLLMHPSVCLSLSHTRSSCASSSFPLHSPCILTRYDIVTNYHFCQTKPGRRCSRLKLPLFFQFCFGFFFLRILCAVKELFLWRSSFLDFVPGSFVHFFFFIFSPSLFFRNVNKTNTCCIFLSFAFTEI